MLRLQPSFAAIIVFAQLASGAARAEEPAGVHRTGYVLVQGGGDVSHLLPIALNAAFQHLEQAPDAAAPLPTSWQMTYSSRLGEHSDAHLYSLDLYWEPGVPVAAEKINAFVKSLCGELESTVRAIQQKGFEIARAQTEASLNQLRVKREELQDVSEKLLGETLERQAQVGGSKEQFVQAHTETEQRVRELKLRNISVEARRQALEQQIDRLRAEAKKSQEDDPLVHEYRAIVDIREQQLKRTKSLHENGVVGGTEVELQEAEANLALARVELIKAQRAAELDSAGPMLRELNNQLSRLVIERAEVEAQSKAANEMAAELQERLAIGQRVEGDVWRIRRELELVNNRLSHTEQRVAEVEQSEQLRLDNEISIRALDEELTPAPGERSK